MGLVYIRTNPDGEVVQFRPDAAGSFLRIEAQLGRRAQVSRTVVPFHVQADLRRRYLAGQYPYYVAPPEVSDHVYRSDTDGGNAWDTEEYRWNLQRLIDNGWKRTDPNEPWHWVYFPELDKYRGQGVPSGNVSIPVIEEENDMRLIYVRDQAGTANLWSLLNPAEPLSAGDNPIQTRDQATANSWASVWGSSKQTDVQGLLNALEAVRRTTKSDADVLAKLKETAERIFEGLNTTVPAPE